MKKVLMAVSAAMMLFFCQGLIAQSVSADDILGKYESKQGSDEYKVEVTKKADGTYKAQLFWVKDPIDHATGKIALDPKNPDKSLRGVRCDRIVLIDGLHFNADKKQWDKAKIYDPQRGIKVSATAKFLPDGRLSVRGSVMGIGETIYWTRIK